MIATPKTIKILLFIFISVLIILLYLEKDRNNKIENAFDKRITAVESLASNNKIQLDEIDNNINDINKLLSESMQIIPKDVYEEVINTQEMIQELRLDLCPQN